MGCTHEIFGVLWGFNLFQRITGVGIYNWQLSVAWLSWGNTHWSIGRLWKSSGYPFANEYFAGWNRGIFDWSRWWTSIYQLFICGSYRHKEPVKWCPQKLWFLFDMDLDQQHFRPHKPIPSGHVSNWGRSTHPCSLFMAFGVDFGRSAWMSSWLRFHRRSSRRLGTSGHRVGRRWSHRWVKWPFGHPWLPSAKPTKNYGKSHLLIGKSNMAIFKFASC